MIDNDLLRDTVPEGLSTYLGIPVILSNQNKKPPNYPYLTYTVTTLAGENNGTYGEWDDGIDRLSVLQTWSISSLAETEVESIMYANKAREWLVHVGRQYLNDRGVIVQRATAIGNRDNVLTVEYERKNGFDVVFCVDDEVERPDNGSIDTFVIGDVEFSGESQEEAALSNALDEIIALGVTDKPEVM